MKTRRLWMVVTSGLLVALSADRSLAGVCPPAVPPAPPAPPEAVECAAVESLPASADEPVCKVEESFTVNAPARRAGSSTSDCAGLWEYPEGLGWPDPWMMLPQTPEVLTDRWSALDRTPPLFAAPGGTADQSLVLLKGVEVSDAASLAAFLVDPSLLPLAVVDAGGFARLSAAPGVRVNLSGTRGGNELRVSAYSLWAARQDGLRRHGTSGVELGGPLRRDRLWLSGGWSRQEARWSGSGRGEGMLQERGSFQLAAQPAADNRATVSWFRGDAARTLEAAPGSGWDRGWDRDGRMEVLLLGDVQVLTPDLYLSGSYGEIDRTAAAAGRAWEAESRARDASLAASLSKNWGKSLHGIEAGAHWREYEEEVAFGSVRMDGGSDSLGLWLQDSWRRADLGLRLGLRYDGERLPAVGADAAAVSPRMELTWTTDRNRTQLRASAGRFASRLGAAVTAWQRAGYSLVDPDLRPEITDELILAVRRDLPVIPDLELRATYRHTRHLLESRPAGTGVPRLASGDGREGSLGLTLQGSGYLDAGQTFVRGHLTWLDWDLPRGGGRPAVLDQALALRSRWSYHLSGTRRLPHAFIASAGVTGREGTLAASDVFTVDARLVREFELRGLRLGLVLDGFNLTGEEVEEPRGPASPLPWDAGADRMLLPQALRLGLRLER